MPTWGSGFENPLGFGPPRGTRAWHSNHRRYSHDMERHANAQPGRPYGQTQVESKPEGQGPAEVGGLSLN